MFKFHGLVKTEGAVAVACSAFVRQFHECVLNERRNAVRSNSLIKKYPMVPHANDSTLKDATATVVESLNLNPGGMNHLSGIVMAREMSKHIF